MSNLQAVQIPNTKSQPTRVTMPLAPPPSMRWRVTTPQPGLYLLEPQPAAPADEFEARLFTYVDLCYSVALTLTHDSEKAQRLAQEVLLWASQRPNELDRCTTLKTELLRKLRNMFIRDYQTVRVQMH